jgi:transposase-like protein
MRSYTEEFKQEAVKLALNSPTISDAAKGLGMPVGTLHTWLQYAKANGACIDTVNNKTKTAAELLEENKKLKKQLSLLENV